MILQTIQPLSIWKDLQANSIVFSKPNYEIYGGLDSTWNFKNAYDWMKEQMRFKNIIPHNNETDIFWGWAWAGDRGKQKIDLRTRRHQLNEPHVLLTLNKKPQDVLLSNFELWHYVLNYWKIHENKEQETMWDNLGDNYNYFLNKPLGNDMHLQIENSWQAIFKLKLESDYFLIDMNQSVLKYLDFAEEKQIVQGTFWNISLCEVQEVKKIGICK